MVTVTDAEAVRLADLNYAEACREVAAGAVAGKVYEEPGLVAVIAGPIPWLNVTVICEELDDPEGAVGRVIEFYRQAEKPFVIRIRDGFAMKTQEGMRTLGLATAVQVPGMVLSPVPEIPPLPDGLVIREWDEASLPEHVEALAKGFGMPMALANSLVTTKSLTGLSRGFTGYVHGKPVAASALVPTNGVAGVYKVATWPEYRKKGLGEAMTWHAVREGVASGCVIGSLQASEMGQPVYARMGFRNIAPYESYILPTQ